MIVNIIGWGLLIISWFLPKRWFNDTRSYYMLRTMFAAIASGIFLGALLERNF